jgi:hypothetical protein
MTKKELAERLWDARTKHREQYGASVNVPISDELLREIFNALTSED